MQDWLVRTCELVNQLEPDLVYFDFGIGPTETIEGHLKERQNVPFTASDIRFTTNGDVLYATILGWPGKEISIPLLGSDSAQKPGTISGVTLLGHDGSLSWKQTPADLTVQMPKKKPCRFAFVLRVEFVD